MLHTTRGRGHYTALFSNTALAHRLDRTDDWVVIYWDDGRGERQYTVIIAERGQLKGQRIVRYAPAPNAMTSGQRCRSPGIHRRYSARAPEYPPFDPGP